MKIVEVVNLNDDSGKFFKSLLKLAGLLFLGTFLFGVTNELLNIGLDVTGFSSILVGLILGMYVGMCMQKTGGIKNWRS